MNSNIDTTYLNDLFRFYLNMTYVFNIKGIHEKYNVGPLR